MRQHHMKAIYCSYKCVAYQHVCVCVFQLGVYCVCLHVFVCVFLYSYLWEDQILDLAKEGIFKM